MDIRKLFIIIVALAAIATGGWFSFQLASPPPEPRVATILPGPLELPEFALLDEQGQPFTRASFEGHWSLVFFGFTHCPDVCPLTLQVLAAARRQLSAAGEEPLPRIVLVSVDPERDSVAAMRDYLGHFDTAAVGVTGPMDELRKLTDALGIFFQRAPGDDENYAVDHSAVVLVVNPEARFVALFSAPHEIDGYVHDVPIVLARQ